MPIVDDDRGSESGSAYIFTRDNNAWSQQAKLNASDGAVSDFFGYSVALDGDLALIGAYLDDDGAIDSGSAYIFRGSGSQWLQEDKLTASDSEEQSIFSVLVLL